LARQTRATWWERAVADGTEWHYVQLAENTAERVVGVACCACGKYRVEQLTVTPAAAGPRLTAAPTDPTCRARVPTSSASRVGPPLVAT
jgi:hypothetical protein